jgi:hypothetical protein
MIKVIKLKKLKSGAKKYEITFEKNGKKYIRKFGAAGMSDYTKHKDKDRREQYISRHKKDLRTKDPMKPGYLSMYILWNKPTIKASLADYKRRLNAFNRTGKFPTKITGSKKLSFGAINRKLCRAEQLRLYEKSLPAEITNIIKKECYANVIKKNYKSANPRYKIILLLKKQGNINFRTTGSDIYIKDLPLNYDIITDSGTQINREMVRLLTKQDFESKAGLWWQLVHFGLTQIKEMYDILYENNGEYDTYRDETDIFQRLEQEYGNINNDTDNIFENFNENVDFILDLLERAGLTYFTRADNEDYSDAGKGVPIDYLIRSWQTLNIRNLFGKKQKTTGSKIPDNVVNKALYSRIKAKIRKDVNKKKRRWGAYDSGRLVREYKAKGGKYRGGKGKTNLGRWYKEKWVDACAWPRRKSCGRKTKEKIAYCRPSKKVDSKTPKLVQKLTKAQIKSRCAKKKRSPMRRITKFGNQWLVRPNGNAYSDEIQFPGDANWTIHCSYIKSIGGTHITLRRNDGSPRSEYDEDGNYLSLDHSIHYGIPNWAPNGPPEWWASGELRNYLVQGQTPQIPPEWQNWIINYYNSVCSTLPFPAQIRGPSPYAQTGFPPPSPAPGTGQGFLSRFGNVM